MSDTREKIVAIAEQLIRTVGYNAFSYKDISTALNIKNAAVHYHYPTKSVLGCAVIAQTMIKFSDQKNRCKNLAPTEKLNSFIGIYEKSDEHNCVCLMGGLTGTYDALPDNMQLQLTEACMEIRDWVIEFLNEGKESKEFHFTCTPEAMADMLIGSMISSLTLKKVSHMDVLSSVKKAVMTVL